jgi:hypothetical protein
MLPVSIPKVRRSHLLPAAILLAAVLVLVATLHADEIPDSVGEYSAALSDLMKSHGRQSIEPVFEAGMKTTSRLQAVLPSLSEAEYQQVQHEMQGFVVVRHRGEQSLVRPNLSFFKALAKKRGTKPDRAFFDIYEQTEPDGNGQFPAYVRAEPNQETGCTMFAGKKLADFYRGWLTFRTANPDAYGNEAQGEMDAIENELQSGICSCDSSDATAAGLQSFVDTFPNLPMTPKIKARIATIRSGNSSFRFNCKG